MPTPWELSGTYFEACNCDVACPCVFLSDPTDGACTVVVAWHIDKGKFDGAPLNGLSFVLAAYSPGNMMKTKWDVALYFDEKASAAQRKALERILSGQEGGPFGALAPLIGKVVGVKSVPIEYRAEGKHRSLRIPQVVDEKVSAIEGAGGTEVTLSNAPLLLVPTVTVAKSEKVSFHDHGWEWEFTGKNSFFAPYVYKST